MESSEKTNKPVQSFRMRGVEVSVFRNEAKNGSFYKVTVQRVYKENDEYRTTKSFSRDDLPVLEMLVKKAWIAVLEAEVKDRQQD